MPEPLVLPSPFPTLADLGWDASYDACLTGLKAQFNRDEVRGGRVLRRDMTFCQVGFGGTEQHCPISTTLLGDAIAAPTTGDFVAVVDGEIVAVLDRRTTLMRGKDESVQLLAANVDFVLVAVSLSAKFRPRRIERLLVIAWQTGAVPIVVLTKADSFPDPSEAFGLAKAVAPGAAVHLVSGLTGDGVAGLADELSPRTTSVIIGPSGAGKSTLTNALSGQTAGLATAEVRSDQKGRHTTVTRELVALSNGALMIDTPGLRSVALWDSEESLAAAFGDVEELAAACRFGDCAHGAEPGCAVLAAIDAGDLDAERLSSYLRLQREQRRLAARTDARLRSEVTKQWRSFNRMQRNQPHH